MNATAQPLILLDKIADDHKHCKHAIISNTGNEDARFSDLLNQLPAVWVSFQPEAGDPGVAGRRLKAPHGVAAEADTSAVPRAADDGRVGERA